MDYINQFMALANSLKLTILVSLVLANFITGLAVGIYTKTFRLKNIALFLRDRVIPFILGYMAVVIVAVVQPEWEALVVVIWGIILATLAGAILQNLRELGVTGIPKILGGGDD